jgi:hypothetical protein
MITVTLQYFDDCPHWNTARERLDEAIRLVGRDLFVVALHPIGVQDHAASEEFRGSPTFLIHGRDPFADPDAPVGLSCRLYPTQDGLAGAPTLEQLIHVLEWALID